MIEQDDAIRDVLLEAAARKRTLASLPRNDRNYSFVFQPPEQPAQFGTENAFILQTGKQCLNRVQHNALGSDRLDGGIQADKQSFEIVLARLLDLTSLNPDEVQGQFLLLD